MATINVQNITGGWVECEFVPGKYVGPDQIVEVPTTQGEDGVNALIWHPDYWLTIP